MYRNSRVFETFLRNGSAAIRSFRRSKSVISERASPSVSGGAGETVKPFEEIPGPKLWPIVGCLPSYITADSKPDPFHKVWERRYEEYGQESKLVAERMFHQQWVNVYSPATVRQVFAQEGKYPARPRVTMNFMRREHLGHGGVAFEEGERWKKGRSLWNRKVLRPKTIEDYIPDINEVSNDFVEHIRREALDGPKEVEGQQLMAREVPDFLTEIRKCALEIMGLVVLSTRLGAIRTGFDLSVDAHRFLHESALLAPHMTALDMSAFKLYRYLPSKKYKATKKYLINLCAITSKLMDEYNERMQDTLERDDFTEDTAPDVYSYFLTKNLPDSELLGYMLDLFQASIDTTSTTFVMLLYSIAKNPRVQERLHKEVSEVLQGGEVTADNLAQLRYLKCCVKESSRLFMTVPGTSRVLDHDTVINGYNIPKGTHINLCFQAMCLDADIFEEPREYRPERWLDVRKAEDMAFSHLPFGFGPRGCVGRRLAEQEIYILLAGLISKFRIENLCDKEPERTWVGFSLVPTDPVRLAFHER